MRYLPLIARPIGRRMKDRPTMRGRAHHAAAYASGDKLTFAARTFNYQRRRRQEEIFSSGLAFPRRVRVHKRPNRQQLWNLAERRENRNDSRVAKSIIVALPNNVDDVCRQRIVDRFVRGICHRLGVAVDWAIHMPPDPDKGNWHAHILITTRIIASDGSLRNKSRFERSDADAQKRGDLTPPELMFSLRQFYAWCCNQELRRVHQPGDVTLLSYRRRKLDIWAERKLGRHLSQLAATGQKVQRAEDNDRIREHNKAELARLKKLDREARAAWKKQVQGEEKREAAACVKAVAEQPGSESDSFRM